MKRLIKTNDQGAQSYMFLQKIKYLWVINLILLLGVVFIGIEQGSKGVDISKLEDRLEVVAEEKRNLSEDIFKNSSDQKLTNSASDLGYVKPSKVYYFDSIDTVAGIR